MDKLMNFGKDMLQQQLSGQGQEQAGSSNSSGMPPNVLNQAQEHASRMAGSSGNSDLFANITGAIGQKQQKIQNEDIDEEEVVKAHQHAYQNDGHGDTSTLGNAAAIQALRKFIQSDNSAGTGSGQAAFLGMAMSEASKLFDSKAAQGKVAGGASKENVVQQAGEMALKLYFKGQAGSQGGLAGLASKFL